MNVAHKFINYPAFAANFEEIIITKSSARNNLYFIYLNEDDFENESWRQFGTKEYIEGWLYGAVQTACGIIKKKGW